MQKRVVQSTPGLTSSERSNAEHMRQRRSSTAIEKQSAGYALALDDIRRVAQGLAVSPNMGLAKSDSVHPSHIETGSGRDGQRFALVAKSADNELGLFLSEDRPGRTLWLVRSYTGARVAWNERVAPVKKAAEAHGGWMPLPGQTFLDGRDIARALTSTDSGVRPTAPSSRHPGYMNPEDWQPGSVQTDETDGVRPGGPSASTPGEVRRRAGQPRVRPGRHSADPVLDRSLNQPADDPRVQRAGSKVWVD